MEYYLTKFVDIDFNKAIDKITALLKEQGFGVITEIDVKDTLKKKINVDFRNYKILGACHPGFAHKALEVEDKLGVLLPCNVIVQEHKDGKVEISAIDPRVMMAGIKNQALETLSTDVFERFAKVFESL